MIQLVNSQQAFTHTGQIPAHEYTIAVFGSQSSGKSTLLNALFGTNFSVLDVRIRRAQCTQGIWLQNAGTYNIVDTQGSDSMQQPDPRMAHYVALFGFSISDLFIVNMWDNEIGRYDGGHTAIMKNIFESALEVEKSTKKIVLFVIKDTPKNEQKNEVMKIMQTDLESIWNKVLAGKPKKVRERPNMDKYFQFQFFFMTLYNKYHDQWEQEAKQLRKLVDNKIKTFPKVKKLPSEELTRYYQNIWNKILKNQEINLINEKRIIIEYCCHRVKTECLQALQRILKFSTNFEKNLTTYKNKAEAIALKYYKQNTSNLDPETSQAIYKELIVKVYELVDVCFHDIQQRKGDHIINSLKRRLEAVKSWKDIQLRIKLGKQDALKQYTDFLEYTQTIEPFRESFQQKMDNQLVIFNEDINRQSIRFQKCCEDYMKQALELGIDKGKFSGVELQKRFQQLNAAFKYQKKSAQTQGIYKQLFSNVLNTYLSEIVSKYVQKSINFQNVLGNQQTVLIHFRQLRKTVQKYLQSVQKYVEFKSLSFNSVHSIQSETNKYLSSEEINQVQKYRSQKITIPKTHLLALLFFAFSEFSALLVLLKFSQAKRMVFMIVYVMLSALILKQ